MTSGAVQAHSNNMTCRLSLACFGAQPGAKSPTKRQGIAATQACASLRSGVAHQRSSPYHSVLPIRTAGCGVNTAIQRESLAQPQRTALYASSKSPARLSNLYGPRIGHYSTQDPSVSKPAGISASLCLSVCVCVCARARCLQLPPRSQEPGRSDGSWTAETSSSTRRPQRPSRASHGPFSADSIAPAPMGRGWPRAFPPLRR